MSSRESDRRQRFEDLFEAYGGDVVVTVGVDGVVRRVAFAWGPGASPWAFTIDYSDLGATPAPVAPTGARPLREPRVGFREG